MYMSQLIVHYNCYLCRKRTATHRVIYTGNKNWFKPKEIRDQQHKIWCVCSQCYKKLTFTEETK